MTPSFTSLLGSSLLFEPTGKWLIALQPDAISVVAPDDDQPTRRLAIDGVRAAAAFPDQLWIVGGDDQLSRVDYAGHALAAPRSLSVATHVLLQPAPCGPPAAVWSAKPALVLGDDDQPATRLEVDLAMPLTGQRFVTARGRKLTLPSGLITMLPPNTTAAGGVVMADGKTAVLVIAHGSGRELIVVSLGTGQIGQRYALPSTSVRIANDRGVVAAQLDPRTLRILDLRAGRDLGVIAFDRDLADHALDPQARRLAVRDTVGDVELVELAEILRTTTGSLAPSVVHQVRTASGRETASPRCVPHKLALAARGRYTHGSFALPCDVCDEVELRSPMTRDVLGVFPCGAGDVDDAVASASLAHGHWTRMTLDARLAVLARIEAGLAQRGGELMSAMQCELGRPAWECRREVEGLVPRLRDLSTQAGQQLGDVGCGAARILRRAHGVVGVVSPVMLPLATAHGHVMSALIAGNTVVWKPSSLTAGSAQLYVEILSAAGLPAGIINLVQGRAAVGRRLLSHAGIDAAIFVGNRAHACEVRRALCDRLEVAAFVHAGAKNPAIVLDGADLEHAASEIAMCAYMSAGQRATALGRVLVQAPLVEPLLAALTRHARRLAATPNFAGPMVSAERYDRYLERLRAAEARGARGVVDPALDTGSLRVGPSIHVVEGVGCASYLHDELFGPDLAVEPVADLSDALNRLRGKGALVTSLFATAADARARCEHEIDAGALLWNHGPAAMSGRLSFAARGGPVRGPNSLDAMTRRIAHVAGRAALAPPFATDAEVGGAAREHSLRAAGGRS